MQKLTEQANFIEHFQKLTQLADNWDINQSKAELLILYAICGLSCKVDHITTELDLMRAVHAFGMYMKTTRRERKEMTELIEASRQSLDF